MGDIAKELDGLRREAARLQSEVGAARGPACGHNLARRACAQGMQLSGGAGHACGVCCAAIGVPKAARLVQQSPVCCTCRCAAKP